MAPAKDRARGGIDARPVGLEFGDPDQIIRDVPQPGALAGALGDELLEVLVQLPQPLFDALALRDVDMRADDAQRLAPGRAFDLGAHLDPAHLAVVRPHDAVLGAIVARLGADSVEKLLAGAL